MSTEFSLSNNNIHNNYRKKTPQGLMLNEILDVTGPRKNVWYADTFSLPTFRNLERYYKGAGTVILYCWWDPADSRLLKYIDKLDLDFIIITSDPDLSGEHERIKKIKWRLQYGFHNMLIQKTAPLQHVPKKTFLCMMRNHKPERLHFLQELWNAELLEDNFVSYLGQVNSSVVHGRTPRTIESILKPTYGVDTEYEFIANSKFAEWCEFSLPLEILGDTSKIFENNTDFYTTGNLEWYKHTQYSVVLETYWARTEFLTEKSFKPIIAKHPFINLGNNSNRLLVKLGFDVFEDVFGIDHDNMSAANKISAIIPKLKSYDIDPKRAANNRENMYQLHIMAKHEQKQIAQQVSNMLI